jgi:hypothetical protein
MVKEPLSSSLYLAFNGLHNQLSSYLENSDNAHKCQVFRCNINMLIQVHIQHFIHVIQDMY